MTGKELDYMTLEQFKFWKVPVLKDFLRKGNLSCVGICNTCIFIPGNL